MSNANNHDERMRLVKTFAYEYVRFNHDPNNAYLVTDVTDDCMLELEGMSGLFAPHVFQLRGAKTQPAITNPSDFTEPSITSGGEKLSIFEITQRFRTDGSCEHLIKDALAQFARTSSAPTDFTEQAMLDWLQDKAEEGHVSMCFEVDGGIHVTLEALGGERRAVRNADTIRDAIIRLMKEDFS